MAEQGRYVVFSTATIQAVARRLANRAMQDGDHEAAAAINRVLANSQNGKELGN